MYQHVSMFIGIRENHELYLILVRPLNVSAVGVASSESQTGFNG